MHLDLAINPFDADVSATVALAVHAESIGCSAVWVADHFSGDIVGRQWSRDPFVSLGAIAAVTTQVDVGVLVANIYNRHPVQLVSAVNSLQSLAPGRVRLGVGSGAAPGSRFAGEHEAIGRVLGTVADRRSALIDQLGAVRAAFAQEREFASPSVEWSGLRGVVDGAQRPVTIVGASAWPTIAVALEHADGVNLRRSGELPELLRRVAEQRRPGFEVSVLDAIDEVDDNGLETLAEAGVDRLVLGISPPHDRGRLDGLVALIERARSLV